MLYGSDERFSGSECLAFEARLDARRKSVRRDNVARFSRPLGALRGPMPHTFVLRSIFRREPALSVLSDGRSWTVGVFGERDAPAQTVRGVPDV